MPITPDQSRAARAMLQWSQDDLATNSRVARATVADFEASLRRPTKNNLLAMEDSMYAAGIEFLPEGGSEGVGVRFRERKLQYRRNFRIENGDAVVPMIYAERAFDCVVPREVLEDHLHGNLDENDREQYRHAISEFLHHIVAAAERQMKLGFGDDRLVLRANMFDPALQ